MGLPGAVSVVAVAERGTMYDPRHIFYMNKIATGPEAASEIDIEAPVRENLARVAKAKRKSVEDITVVILDRPRHEGLIKEIRSAGARIRLIQDGDISGALTTCMPGSGIDLLLGGQLHGLATERFHHFHRPDSWRLQETGDRRRPPWRRRSLW